MQAYKERIDTVQQLAAWHAANIMNCWTKRPIKPDKLLGKRETVELDDLRGGGKNDPMAAIQEIRRQEEELRKKHDVIPELEREEIDIERQERDNEAWLESVLGLADSEEDDGE